MTKQFQLLSFLYILLFTSMLKSSMKSRKKVSQFRTLAKYFNLYTPAVYFILVVLSFFLTLSYIVSTGLTAFTMISLSNYLSINVIVIPLILLTYMLFISFNFFFLEYRFAFVISRPWLVKNNGIVVIYTAVFSLFPLLILYLSLAIDILSKNYNSTFPVSVFLFLIILPSFSLIMARLDVQITRGKLTYAFLIYFVVFFACLSFLLLSERTFLPSSVQANLSILVTGFSLTLLSLVLIVIFSFIKKSFRVNYPKKLTVMISLILFSILYFNYFIPFRNKIASIAFRIAGEGNYYLSLPKDKTPHELLLNGEYKPVYVLLKDENNLYVSSPADLVNLEKGNVARFTGNVYKLDKDTYQIKDHFVIK